MKPLLPLKIAALVTLAACASTRKRQLEPGSSPVEVTATDFTKISSFSARNATVFGIGLGMERAAVEALIKRNTQLLATQDTANPSRLYIYQRGDSGEPRESLFYFIWEPGNPKLNRITFFVGAARHLVGDARKLLTLDAVDSRSRLSQHFLGAAARSQTTLDIPLTGTRHVTYYYPARGIEVTDKVSTDGREAVFAFAYPDVDQPAP